MLVCFFGKRGSGKTTAIKGQLDSFEGPVVVIDILGNFNDPKFIQVERVDECIKIMKDYAVSDKKSELEKVIVLKAHDPNQAADYISATLWHLHGGTLVLDEMDAIKISESPCLDQLIRYGRNRNIHLITGVRRPAEISRNVTAGANKVYCFRTQEPRDVDYFEGTVLGEKAEQLMSLPSFHGLYVDYDNNTIGQFKIDKAGKLTRLDSASQVKNAKPKQEQVK